MRRTQIYLEEAQDRRLEARAKAEGRTKSAVIREAIDRFLGAQSLRAEVAASLERTAGALPELDVPDRAEWERGYG